MKNTLNKADLAKIYECTSCESKPIPESEIDYLIASACDDGGWGPEHTQAAIYKGTDGKFWAVEEWEDTSGHGCMCGFRKTSYTTFDDAYKFGLTENGREILKGEIL